MTWLFSPHQLTIYDRPKCKIQCANTISASRLLIRERIINPTTQATQPISHYQCGCHDHISTTTNRPIQSITTFQLRMQCPSSVSVRSAHSPFPPHTSFSKRHGVSFLMHENIEQRCGYLRNFPRWIKSSNNTWIHAKKKNVVNRTTSWNLDSDLSDASFIFNFQRDWLSSAIIHTFSTFTF